MVKNVGAPPEPAELPTRLIDHVEVEVEVILGDARLSVAELARLEPGDFVAVDRKLSEAAEIRVNGRVIDAVMIDKSIEDGYLIIWKGVTLGEINIYDKSVPRIGAKDAKGKKKD